MRRFDYCAPATLSEAIAIFQSRGYGGKLLAGGTDLLVQMKEGGLRAAYMVSLRHLRELQGIDFSDGDGLRFGALTTMAQLAQHPAVRERYPLLVDSAQLVGSIQTRNMATVGGNLCNAAPSADLAPPLIALGAVARLAGPSGERRIALEEFFLGPGRTVLGPDEILVDLRVPVPPAGSGAMYTRHTPRKQMDIAAVGVGTAVTLRPGDGAIEAARIVLGAVAPTPLRARQAEAALAGQPPSDEAIGRAAQMAAQEARPISDVRGSASFRREMVRVLTQRMLRGAIDRAKAFA